MKGKIKQMIFAGLVLFVIIFSSIWYGTSNSLCSMIDDGKTDKAIAMIDKMSTTHINSYSAPLFMRPLYGMIESDIKLPLVSACQMGNYEAVKALLTRGADPNKFLKKNWSSTEATFGRTWEQRYEIAKLLIDYGADVNLYGGYYPALLEEARLYFFADVDEMEIYRNMQLLLDNGANIIGPEGLTALHYAAIGNKAKATKELIENYYPAVDYTTEQEGKTPLIWGAKEGSTEAVKVLLEYGADKSIKDTDGKTAYDYAIENGHTELAELLKP